MNLNFDNNEKKLILTTFFCLTLIIANLISVKIITIPFLKMDMAAGIIIYPLAFVLINVITSVYGEKTAQKTITIGILSNVFFVLLTTIILFLPSPMYYQGDASLSYVFTQTPRILVASYISCIVSNLINAKLTSNINHDDKYSKIKNLGVIGFSILINDIIFLGISFIFVYSLNNLIIMILSEVVLALIWIIIAEPFINPIIKWAIKGKETPI